MANSSDEEEEDTPEELEEEEQDEDEEHDGDSSDGRPGLVFGVEPTRSGVKTPPVVDQKDLLDNLVGNVSDEDSGSWEEELGYGTK